MFARLRAFFIGQHHSHTCIVTAFENIFYRHFGNQMFCLCLKSGLDMFFLLRTVVFCFVFFERFLGLHAISYLAIFSQEKRVSRIELTSFILFLLRYFVYLFFCRKVFVFNRTRLN